MIEQVRDTILRYRMLDAGQAIGVAVSGGADSVCLLHALHELAPRWNLRLSVLHLNHRLRGEESLGDAEFVRDLAESLQFPFTLREADVAASPENLEEAAREARLAFFREVLASRTVDRIALGHTRSDQAETVLFRFLRGSGTAGLAGIRPVTAEGIVRPLIAVERAAVQQFLRGRGIPWREDSSNLSLQFARNRIRHQLLPQLAREWNPAIVETLAHTADWALAEETYWEAELKRLVADRVADGRLLVKDLAILLAVDTLDGLPMAAARRLLRHVMEGAKGDLRGIDFRHVEAVLELASGREGHGRLQAPGLDIIRSFGWLRFGRPEQAVLATRNYRLPVVVPGTVQVPGTNLVILLELVEKPEASEPANSVYNSVYNSEMGCLDWQRLSGSLELRNWRPGDQYQPMGCTGDAKIKTLFQEHRVPLWERRNWPVLLDGSSIVWARRFGPAAAVSAGPASRVMLRIRVAE